METLSINSHARILFSLYFFKNPLLLQIEGFVSKSFVASQGNNDISQSSFALFSKWLIRQKFKRALPGRPNLSHGTENGLFGNFL
jgi:hypothetical protein